MYNIQPRWVHWFCFLGGLDHVMEYIIDNISSLSFLIYQYIPNLKIWNHWSVTEIKMTTFWLQISWFYVTMCEMAMPCSVAICLHTVIDIPQGDLVWHTCDVLSQPMWRKKGQLVKFPACNWVTAQPLLFHRVPTAHPWGWGQIKQTQPNFHQPWATINFKPCKQVVYIWPLNLPDSRATILQTILFTCFSRGAQGFDSIIHEMKYL